MLYPILTESRLLVNLDGVWDFKTDNGNGIKEGWYAKNWKTPCTCQFHLLIMT